MGTVSLVGFVIGIIAGYLLFLWNSFIAYSSLKLLPQLASLTWWEAISAGFSVQWFAIYYPWVAPVLLAIWIIISFASLDG